MRKIVFLTMATALLTFGGANAQTVSDSKAYVYNEQDLQPLTPTYLDNVYASSVWASNWFLSVKGGIGAFIGKPVGHGDIFDRTKPVFIGSIGKWVSPYFGARATFEGFKLYDSNIESRSFQNIHIDGLYNISSHFRNGFEQLPKWDFIIYAGTGIIRNSYTHQKPFGISYGAIGRYRIAPRLHLEAELGGTTTWQSFDGIGADNKLGDNLFHAALGLSVTIGNVGFKRVIDPKPYVYQNDVLMEYLGNIKDENIRLNKLRQKDQLSLAEMRKILEIEGLLDKYNLSTDGDSQVNKIHPKNNYSGLNSLRARLRGRSVEDSDDVMEEGTFEPNAWNPTDSTSLSPKQYFRMMKDGKIFVGTPVFFFFKIGSAQLSEQAQIINLREIASVIKKYGLCARVVGAADSQTGTPYNNEQLSQKRADYIAKLLMDQGVEDSKITAQYRGGISTYVPMEGNRNSCVMLYYKE